MSSMFNEVLMIDLELSMKFRFLLFGFEAILKLVSQFLHIILIQLV